MAPFLSLGSFVLGAREKRDQKKQIDGFFFVWLVSLGSHISQKGEEMKERQL
jgi:hypothetical protein